MHSLGRIAYMHYTFKLGTSQLGVWFLFRWYSVFLCVMMRGTLLTLKISWRKLCNSMIGLVWISSLVWPPLAFQIIWFNWCHPSNLVSFYNAQGSSAAKIALGICFRRILILYWYWWFCIVYFIWSPSLLKQQQLVSSHFSLWGNGGRVVGNRNHRLSSQPPSLTVF